MNRHSAPSPSGRISRAPIVPASGPGARESEGPRPPTGGDREIDAFRKALGPFVVAAEETRMAMAFTNTAAAGHKIIFANDSFLSLMGYARGEVMGRSFERLMSRVAKSEARENVAAQFREDVTETIEVACRRRDGHDFLAAMRVTPVRDEAGKIVQHFVSLVDLGEHADRIRRETEAVHALYQHTPDFIATMEGPDHRFSFANDAYQRLAGDRAVVGKSVATALPELVGQGFVALLDLVYNTGAPFTGRSVPINLIGKTAAEATRFVDFTYQAIRGRDGKITGVFCEGHDVTEQKRARDLVVELRAEMNEIARASGIGTMAATLAHELNQPLTAILNYASVCTTMIEAVPPNTASLTVAIDGIIEGARRAGEIIRRLRNMTEGRAPHREVFDLGDAIRESVGLIQTEQCAGVLIDDVSCGGVTLEADRVQIQQVIKNLTRNACEAIADTEDGHVAISTTVRGNDVVVSVRDNGPGVAPEAAARLFEWSDSTKADGMGIGLSICRTIVEAHRGKIWLEPASAGANFCFTLPMEVEA